MFEKSLQDLVKGIRAHKRDPAAFVSTAIAECKRELKNVDPRTATMEPESYSIGDSSGFVKSDMFSFVDMTPQELAAKGNGGTRMMYNYSTINMNEKIHTPPEDYTPNKVNADDIKKYEEARAASVPRN